MHQNQSEGGHHKAKRPPTSSFYEAEGVWSAPIGNRAISKWFSR
jgi:hypothetical protein